MRTILVVDDDAVIRQLVRDVLESEGYVVYTAADGETALQRVATDRPDCVVLDVMMPGLSGHEVLARLRAQDLGLPVVMLTAADNDTQAWQAWSGGVDYFLAKPFDAAELLRYLDQLFSGAAGMDRAG